ncbi:MAG: 6-carboxytetrahydropterin synthase QueD [Desulfatiglans sp.]|jgi:6-pyruvoyltetrahydropterin/6-carboxytetrahydropterin synthase|nr:6-carboxytetrahydropterin synthase QueD [Thermodesulfobacteriota bacterium]MEE4352399.1 6-carboxytetrahydropterin synthase QueD [Desulfatiglans sp.]
MYELRVITRFASAHQLRDYGGKCENLHGHNWKIEVFVTGDSLEDNGLLIDFRLVKEAAKSVVDKLDHQCLNEIDPFTTQNPSSENIARYLFESLSQKLNNRMIRVSRVSAWESDTACASYSEP